MGRSIRLALLTQLATYRQRFWEPLLIVVAIFIASAGLTAVTLINAGASTQLNQLTIGQQTLSWQVRARSEQQPLTPADYAALRRAGFDQLVAYATDDSGVFAVDSTAIISLFPVSQGSDNAPLSSVAVAAGMQDLNTFYQGERTPVTHPLDGLAVVAPVTPELLWRLEVNLPVHLQLAPIKLKQSGNNLSDSFSLNLWAMGALMLLVSVFIVFNALNLLLAARTSVLAKLRQLGISQRILLLVLILEMFLLALPGAVGGVLAGSALITTITPVLSNIYRFLLDGQFSNSQLATSRLLIYSVLLCGGAALAMAPLVNKRLRQCLSIRSAMVAAYTKKHHHQHWRWLMPAILLLVPGAYLVGSQLQALLYIGAVLIAGCLSIVLLMPGLIGLVAKSVSARRPVLHWSVHNAVSLSQRTRLAACAFFIALTANIGMNVMVDSFRQATQQWLEQRLFAPFYLYTSYDGDLSARADAPVRLLARYGQDVRVGGQLTELRSFPDAPDFKQYLLLDSITPDAWPAFYAQQGVFINQQLAYRQHLSPGDNLSLPLSAGPKTLRVVGVYPDYGNPKAQVLLPERALASGYEQISAYAAFIGKDEQPPLQQWLLQLDPEARMIAREALIEQSMMVFSRTFMTTDTLNLVTMLVAALSFFVSITLLLLDIKPQLLLLRSVGVSPFSIKLALFIQYCFIALSCALLALPFALLLAWLLVNKVNRFAFHWTYPLQLDPLVVLQSLVIGLGVLLVLMALPLGRVQAKFYSQREAL